MILTSYHRMGYERRTNNRIPNRRSNERVDTERDQGNYEYPKSDGLGVGVNFRLLSNGGHNAYNTTTEVLRHFSCVTVVSGPLLKITLDGRREPWAWLPLYH